MSPLITHRFPIEQAAEALAVAADRNSGSSKVMLRLGGCRVSERQESQRLREASRAQRECVSVVTVGETMALLDAPASGRLGAGSALPIGIGGAESNVAIGLARLGVGCTWVSRVGDDALGTFVTREIRGEGVRVLAPGTRRADRADAQGAPQRAAVARPLLPQRQRGVPAVAGRHRRAWQRRSPRPTCCT